MNRSSLSQHWYNDQSFQASTHATRTQKTRHIQLAHLDALTHNISLPENQLHNFHIYSTSRAVGHVPTRIDGDSVNCTSKLAGLFFPRRSIDYTPFAILVLTVLGLLGGRGKLQELERQ
jgi:hypothetical protein